MNNITKSETTTYFEITYRNRKPVAAYIHLPRRAGDVSVRVFEHTPGILIDYTKDGRAIGIELLNMCDVTIETINDALSAAGQHSVTSAVLLLGED